MSRQNDETRRLTQERLRQQRLDTHSAAAKGSAALRLFRALQRGAGNKPPTGRQS